MMENDERHGKYEQINFINESTTLTYKIRFQSIAIGFGKKFILPSNNDSWNL